MYCVAYVTASGREEGERIARGLVERRLAACVNLVPGIHSIYRWEGKVEEAEEVLLVIKTRGSLIPHVIAWVTSQHSYTVPEVIAIPIQGGHAPYLQWIDESVAGADVKP